MSKIPYHRFIAAERAHFPVSLLCRVLGVSRSGFHAWFSGAFRAGASRCLAHRANQADPQGQPRHLRVAQGARRPSLRGRSRLAQAGRAADAEGGHSGLIRDPFSVAEIRAVV